MKDQNLQITRNSQNGSAFRATSKGYSERIEGLRMGSNLWNRDVMRRVGLGIRVILLGIAFMHCLQLRGQYSPIAWWSFDTVPYGQDVSGNGHHFGTGVTLQVEGTTPQLRDSFLQVIPQQQTPLVINYLDPPGTVRDALTMEFWFRGDRQYFSGRMLSWLGKAGFELSEMGISWVVVLEGGSLKRLDLSFCGAAVMDAHNVLDGEWHHIAGSFDVKTGTQRLYIDGHNAPGMTIQHGTGPGLAESLGFTPYNSNSDGLCDLDEIAVYDTVLPPDLVYQHWFYGMQGQAYAANVNPAGPMAPNPPNVAPGGIDTLEYGPRYPSVPLRSNQLLAGYPAPRYRPGHAMPRLLPWFNDSYNIANNTPLAYPASTGGGYMKDMLKRLATDYNYYLWLGGAMEYLAVDSLRQVYYQIQMANDPANDTLPRFLVHNWRHIHPSDLSPALATSCYMLWQGFPASYFLRNSSNIPYTGFFNYKRWNWAAIRNPSDPRLDSLDFDGLTARYYLSLVNSYIPKPIAMIGENEETLINFDSTLIAGDPEMLPDWSLTALDVGHYESMRATDFRRRFSGHYTAYQDSQAYQSDPVQLYWYNVGGKLGGGGFLYDSARVISRFADGNHRGTNYWYPETPARWRHGNGVIRGLDQIARSRREEVLAGDRRFMPGVSPGFSEREGGWFSNDLEMLRPAQFLAGLKAMGMMGADGYAMYMTHGDATSIVPMQGNWRAWQPVMPAYAQAVTERLGDLVGEGYLLDGDLGHVLLGGGFTLANYFTFNTGNRLDLIVARKHETLPIYGIHGSAQRLTNAPSHGPKEKVVDFALQDSSGMVIDTLQLEIRAQGSTYILDMTGPDTVFYQLDGWHEWTDPWRWCRDFLLEGELADTTYGGTTSLHTERPGVGGDFREFTTWLELDASESAEYGFTTRHAEQNTMYIHVLGRRLAGGSNQVAVYLDGSLVGNLTLATNWSWYNVALLQLPPLGQGRHTLRLSANANDVQIDKTLLSRSLQSFWGQSFLPLAMAEDSVVCLDDSAQFHAGGNLPSGCLDYRWDFGDGTFGYSADPAHRYVYPDTYQVVLSVHHACLDSTAWDTLEIVVRAPHVEAGRDTFICAGDTLQLQGEGTYFIRWREDSVVSSQIVPQPLAWPGSDGYLHLDGWDPLSGCHASDSVHVTVLALPSTNDTTLFTCNVGNGLATQLGVRGGYWVWWEPDTLLSSDTVRNPTAILTASHVFTAYISDICRCDTDTVSVTVLAVAGLPALVASQDTFCEGDTLWLSVQGVPTTPVVPVWSGLFGRNVNGGLVMTASGSPVPALPFALGNATTPQTLQYTVSTNQCASLQRFRDTLEVVMVPLPHLDGWQDTVWACPGAVVSPVANALHAAPTTWSWSPAWAFTNPNVQNAQIAGGVTSPTMATLTVGSALGCPVTYQTLLMPMGLLPDSIYQCPGDSLELRVSASLGAGVAGFITWAPGQFFSSIHSPSTMVSVPAPTQVTVEYAYMGCGAMQDTVTVIPHGLPEVLGPDTIRGCAGDTLPLEAVLASPVQWGISGLDLGDSTANLTWTVAQGQPFTLYVASLDSFFCPGFDSVLVTWQDAILGDSFTMCVGDTVELATMPGCSSAVWTPNTEISATTGCGVQVWPSASRWYVVELYDSAGCYARDSAWVEVDSGCCHIAGVDTLLRNTRISDYVALMGTSSLSNLHLYIRDTLWIDTASVYFSNTIFEMGVSATVVVEPGRILGTNSCIFRSACGDSVWNTILVDSATAYYKSTADSFRDATAAVSSQYGGQLSFDHCWFGNSLRHVVVQPWGSYHPAAFTGNLFSGGAIIPPYQGIPAPIAGIDLDGVTAGINIGDNGLTPNTFTGLQYGIHMNNSQATVKHNIFRDIQPPPGPAPAVGKYSGIRANCSTWGEYLVVGALGTAGLPDTAQGNKFQHCRYGVYVDGVQHLEAYSNTFDSISQRGISARQQNKNIFGVVWNTFSACKLGIYSGLGRNLKAEVRTNAFNGDTSMFRTAILIDGATYYPTDNAPFLVINNEIDLGGDGVWVRNSDHVHVEVNEIYMRPTPLGLNASQGSHGVKFQHADTCRVYNNAIESDASNMDAAREWMRGVWVDTGPESDVSCNDVLNFGWSVAFRSLSPGMTFYHNQLTNAMDGLVLTGTGFIGFQGGAALPSGNLWVGVFDSSMVLSDQSDGVLSRIYAQLDSTLPVVSFVPEIFKRVLASGIPVPFFSASLSEDTLPIVCQDFPKPWTDKTSILATLIALEEDDFPVWPTENRWKARHWVYTTLLQHPELTEDDDELEDFMDEMEDGATAWIIKADQSLRAAEYADAENALTKFSPANLVEQNHVDQKTLQILLETDPTAFGSADTAALRAIALQCPDVGGNAVWEARTLMALLGEIIDAYGCDSTSSKVARGNSNLTVPEGWVSVWPNPTSSDVFVRLGGSAADGGTFLLHNLQGQERLRVSLSTEAPTRVALGDQPAATYFWSFVSRSGTTYRGKLVVVK